MSRHAFIKMSARSYEVVCDQLTNADEAAATAASASAIEPSGTEPRLSPVAGLVVSKIFPEMASFHAPLMNMSTD